MDDRDVTLASTVVSDRAGYRDSHEQWERLSRLSSEYQCRASADTDEESPEVADRLAGDPEGTKNEERRRGT
jgi:hypothetical protein